MFHACEKLVNSDIPKINVTADPKLLMLLLIAVAATLSFGGNQTAERAGIDPVDMGPPTPFRNCPI